MTEAGRLRQDLAKVRKELEKCGTKLVLLSKVGDVVAVTKNEVAKLVTSVTKAQEHPIFSDSLTRERKVELEQLRNRNKSLSRYIASVKKVLAGVKVENTSPDGHAVSSTTRL